MSTRIRLTILAVVAVLYSIPAWSLGLGDARVQSFIGQPLELHIELLTSPGDDLGTVSARLASAEDFAMIGASREAISVPLSFQVREGDSSSGSHILVTSRLAVGNPVVRLVVEVNWSSGRLLREYTIFLDPPTVPSQAPEPVVSRPERPPATAPAPVVTETAPDPVSEPAPEPVQAESAPPPAATDNETDEQLSEARQDVQAEESSSDQAPSTTSMRYGPVRNGQTLWQIASGHIGNTGLDMNQVMVAIQRKNPDAFVDGNINLLKRGETLDLPSEIEMHQLSSSEARELVAQQEAAFRMRSTLVSSSTPLLASESAADSSVDTPTSDSTEVSESQPAEEAVSRLEIVPASDEDLATGEPGTGVVPGGEGSDEVEADIRAELARTEEALISAQQENEYLQDRIAELEQQLGNSDGAATDGLIADDELSELEDRLQAERLAQEDETTAVAEQADNQIPKVTTMSDQESDRPWFTGPMIWIIMIIIVVTGIVGWIFNRRRAGEHYDLDADLTAAPVSGLKDEAEEILRALDTDPEDRDEEQLSSAGSESESTADDEAISSGAGRNGTGEGEKDAPADDTDSIAVLSPGEPGRSRKPQTDDHGDARVLDENSSDPEIQLDLARAYISMGDKEAARAILDEVQTLGNEAQKSEAREMLDKI